MDEGGYVKIVDRKKDMILVSGFNVYPNELEGVIAGHPGVLECAVIGVPDEHSGEAVKVFVVKKDPNLTDGRAAGLLQAAVHRLQDDRSTSSSATSCRRPTSARSCAARCATKSRRTRWRKSRRTMGNQPKPPVRRLRRFIGTQQGRQWTYMDKFWLTSYETGVPAEIDCDAVPLADASARGGVSQVRRPQGLRLHGQVHHLRRTRHDVAAQMAAWLQAQRPEAGRARGAS